MNIKEATEMLKVIADESRLRIIKALSKEKKICGNDLLVKVECKQATLSHHMSVLTECGLVKAKRSGNKVQYSLVKSELESLANFLYGEKVQTAAVVTETKPVEVAKAEEVKEVNKPSAFVETVKAVEEVKSESKGNPVSISVPIWLL